MSDKVMMAGQLYRVGVTCISAHERCFLELILVAGSNEDVKRRLPWTYDFSGWDLYRIDWTVKEPDRCVVLKSKYERSPENVADASLPRQGGTQAMFQKATAASGKRYEAMARAVFFASSVDHAKRKLAERISGGSESVQYSIEELALSSPYSAARDVSVFPLASFVRG